MNDLFDHFMKDINPTQTDISVNFVSFTLNQSIEFIFINFAGN